MSVEIILICMLLLINIALTLWAATRSGGAVSLEAIRNEFRSVREENLLAAKNLREEIGGAQAQNTDTLSNVLSKIGDTQSSQLLEVKQEVRILTEKNEERGEKLTNLVSSQLESMRKGNEEKLDKMRETVDEKLQGTLERRLGESFQIVSKHLNAVHEGLGEMRKLATGVGDLKAVLTNVKMRGTWGEVQLGALLEQVLTTDQYLRNAKPDPKSNAIVEFAIRLPGRDGHNDSEVLLPIDAKFPIAQYNRLIDASREGDQNEVERQSAGLKRTVESFAKDIQSKYIVPPHTTDFAILFLPTEGLYAEIVRSSEMLENLQRNYRVIVAGPTTLAAILNSLQIGFRTLAIEQRSSEVWQVLIEVKNEFEKFGKVLEKVKGQVNTVSNTLEQTDVRMRAMDRTFRELEKPLDRKETGKLTSFGMPPDGNEEAVKRGISG